jgi:sulfur-carrier protein
VSVATVRLRLFAAARDAAGCASATLDVQTLGDALERARAAYGAPFTEILERSRVWVNGDEAVDGDATVLADDDEIAVLPPVSGGR